MEEKGVGIYFLILSNSKVQGRVKALGWGLGRMTSGSIIHTNLHKPSWLVHGWSNFGTRIHHKHTHTHNTHHGQDFGKDTTFLLIIFYVLGHGAYTQMSFYL
jgi:hypothetical protein